jgi:hypothetical protein
MHVHIIVNGDAYQFGGNFNNRGLLKCETCNLIGMHAYNVTPELPQLKLLIVDRFALKVDDPNSEVLGHSTLMHAIGCFFYLFANHAIPTLVKYFLYMDTNVAIMANLEELWQEV